jgi:putative PEP-CTERM system TPR-repeat lipoprotein
MQANPDVLQPATLLGSHYLRLGEKQKALALAKKLEGTHSKDPAVLDLLAQAQLANNDKSSALESYARLAVVQPESALVQFRIASIHMAMQNFSAASDALKKSLTIKPDYLAAQLAQIKIEAEQDNYEKAIAMARQVQKQHKGSPAGYIAEGDLLLKQKKPALAASAYEQAFAINKNPALLIKLHASLRQAGKDKEADLRLTEWLKKHPDDLPIRMYLADTFLTEGKLADAVEQYQNVLKEQPKFAPALNNLATAYQHQKDPRALEYAEKAYQLATENPAVLDTLGWILVEQGDTARGLPLLQKAVSLAPQVGEIRYHFAVGLVKSGQKIKARQELEQLLANAKNTGNIDEVKALLIQVQ